MSQTIVEMNGRVCCLLELPCCEPPANLDVREMQVEAVGELFYKASQVERLKKDDPFQHIARALLEHVLLVPRQLDPRNKTTVLEENNGDPQPVRSTHPRLLELKKYIKKEMDEISTELGYGAGRK